ncbi:MAG: hypothetical protein BWK73_03920 [Thiothrix lacustris]|uniref:histidine kinase n=1 Tax=Thiothrix lacustris TaxID=525917 RepID=A0A1Y1QXV8_9GAMM|nr:MAG: hypothetical protein BWK73_03920 [Thiothrix lacustris]
MLVSMLCIKNNLLLSLLLWCWCAGAWAAPLVLYDYHDQAVFPAIEMLEDSSGKLALTDVLSPAYRDRFKPAGQGTLQHLGYTASVWWVRFEVEQRGTIPRHVLLNAQNDYSINVFAIPLSDPAKTRVLARVVDLPWPSYELGLMANQPQQIYVQLTPHFNALSFKVSVVSQERAVMEHVFPVALWMLAMGGVLSLAAYNLFLYFSFREDSYLWLVAFIVALCGELALINGTLYWVVKSEDWYRLLAPFPGFLMITTALGFFRRLINTPQSTPFFDKIIVAIIRISLVLIVSLPVLSVTAAWSAGLGGVVLLVVVTATLQATKRGYRLARTFTYALFVLSISIAPVILMGLGMIANASYGLYVVHWGVLGFVLLLSQTQVEHTRALREMSERAVAASQAKTEFLATMSHELRTPMNAVVGLSALLRMTPLNTEQQDYLEKLGVSSRHMLHLIDDILDFSRIEQRGLELANEPFQLRKLVAEISQILQDQAQCKGIRFECQAVFTDGADVRGDATRLSQILLNLAGNAIKFTEQGQVTLSVTERSHTADALEMLFAVSDTGQGISAAQLQKLFQPFVQGEGNSAKAGGFGLGLVISQRLVQAMGGELQVESQVGEGSRFYFTVHFPKAARDAVNLIPAPVEAPILPDHSPKRILLVDDDEINRFVACRLLETKGFAVTLAADGQAALDVVYQQAAPFDLVLMDVSMPGMNGYETTRQLRTRGYQLPIIALTAHAVSGERERCEAAGMNDFFTKPFELHELEQMVSQWITTGRRSG